MGEGCSRREEQGPLSVEVASVLRTIGDGAVSRDLLSW